MNAKQAQVATQRALTKKQRPAVDTREGDPNCSRADVLAATRVPCQWDNMGTDFIVYPQKQEDSW